MGLRHGEIWIHMAHVGELKSTLAQNVAYNASTRYRRNVVYFCLEGRRRLIRDSLLVLHSANPKWGGRASLSYRGVRDGELTAEDEQFYKVVLDDYETNPEYCRLELVTITADMTPAQMRAEL